MDLLMAEREHSWDVVGVSWERRAQRRGNTTGMLWALAGREELSGGGKNTPSRVLPGHGAAAWCGGRDGRIDF